MSAIDSFTFLSDNVPSWISKLDLLSHQVSERYAEFTRLSRTSGGSIGSIRRKKTGSTESLRHVDPDDQLPATPDFETAHELPLTPARVEVNPENKRLFQDFRDQARRKRKSASIISGASGPQRFRSRLSLIVYYDSAIQEGFEWLVRKISGARNNLRKGKTAASFKARVASLGMEDSPFRGDRTNMSLRSSNLPRSPRNSEPSSIDPPPLEAFDVIDKELEAAQSLCEVGAHQFLRDGSCNEEISGTKDRFQSCLSTAQQQLKVLKIQEEEEKSLEQERQNPMTNGMNGDAQMDGPAINNNDLAVDHTGNGNGQFDGIAIDSNSLGETDSTTNGNGQPDGLALINNSLAVDPLAPNYGDGMIEIDEGEDSNSFHVDLAAFRSTRRNR